jgi:hypothetical protein
MKKVLIIFGVSLVSLFLVPHAMASVILEQSGVLVSTSTINFPDPVFISSSSFRNYFGNFVSSSIVQVDLYIAPTSTMPGGGTENYALWFGNLSNCNANSLEYAWHSLPKGVSSSLNFSHVQFVVDPTGDYRLTTKDLITEGTYICIYQMDSEPFIVNWATRVNNPFIPYMVFKNATSSDIILPVSIPTISLLKPYDCSSTSPMGDQVLLNTPRYFVLEMYNATSGTAGVEFGQLDTITDQSTWHRISQPFNGVSSTNLIDGKYFQVRNDFDFYNFSDHGGLLTGINTSDLWARGFLNYYDSFGHYTHIESLPVFFTFYSRFNSQSGSAPLSCTTPSNETSSLLLYVRPELVTHPTSTLTACSNAGFNIFAPISSSSLQAVVCALFQPNERFSDFWESSFSKFKSAFPFNIVFGIHDAISDSIREAASSSDSFDTVWIPPSYVYSSPIVILSGSGLDEVGNYMGLSGFKDTVFSLERLIISTYFAFVLYKFIA